ncbi:deoxyribonuclease [ANME-1 cluster archaeon AG-394-G21]|nr:deoxyribonuclease [ANME-1 cluster archaeon AG-394-G21]NAT10477.1 deoxyribonuclease [ANME-1 cluster archaeon AG-394-G06]
MSGERRDINAPLNVGDTYDVTVEDVGREGDGIARVEGFVVFVPNTKKGDNVKIRISKVSRRVGFGEVVTE